MFSYLDCLCLTSLFVNTTCLYMLTHTFRLSIGIDIGTSRQKIGWRVTITHSPSSKKDGNWKAFY